LNKNLKTLRLVYLQRNLSSTLQHAFIAALKSKMI